jgi:hypothetical protein
LAGKTGKEYIKIRNGSEVNFLNISFGFFTEVSFVGYTGKLIPFRCKNAFTPGFFKA